MRNSTQRRTLNVVKLGKSEEGNVVRNHIVRKNKNREKERITRLNTIALYV